MHKIDFKTLVMKCLMITGLAILPISIQASAQVEDECSEEVIISYFPSEFVKNTLQTYQIPESERNAIIEELKEKNPEVIKFVEEKAGKMDPNPLKDPKSRAEAIAIFKEALMTSFKDVMSKHGVTDDQQLQKMLDDIQHQKAKRFSECLEKHMKEMKDTK